MRKYLPLLLLLLAPAAHGQCSNATMLDYRDSGTNGVLPTRANLLASTFGQVGTISYVVENPVNNLTMATAAHHATVGGNPLLFCNGGATYTDTGTLGLNLLTGASANPFSGALFCLRANGFCGSETLTGTVATVVLATTWFRTTLPQTATVNCDCFTIYGQGTGGSGSSTTNAILSSSGNGGPHLRITIEPFNGVEIPIATNVWYQLALMYTKSGVAGNNGNRIMVFDSNGVQVGSTIQNDGPNDFANYLAIGDTLAGGDTAGFAIQYDKTMVCYLGCTAANYPMMEPDGQGAGPTLLSHGIITDTLGASRAIDWTQAGIPGFNNGTLPDAAWPQSGATIAAGATFATVQTAINNCGANQFVLLGPGTFSFNTALLKMKSNCVLRGSGANTTFLNATATNGTCAQGTTMLCFTSDGNSYTTCCDGTGSGVLNVCNWTAGYAQGSSQITLSTILGNCPGSIVPNQTLLFIDQCDTGLTGSLANINCTGSSTDNGNLFVCGQKWLGGPAGCSSSGPDGGGSRNQRTQMEAHVVTASLGGGVYTISPPLMMPNWNAGQFPQVYIAQPIVNSGIENMAIDVSNPSGPNVGIGCVNGYHVWVSGVKVSNGNGSDTNFLQCVNSILQNSYIFQDRHGAGTNNAGYDFIATFNMNIQNNICQNVVTCFFDDGASSGNVLVDNFAVADNAAITGSDLIPSYTGHAYNYYNLQEGNVFSQLSCDDNHGTCDFDTKYRNFLTGWQSFPSNPKTADTSSIEDYPFSRYHNNVANVLGTPGYHLTYKSTSVNTTIIKEGAPFGIVPLDPLTASTSMHWGEFNTVNSITRFCLNATAPCTGSEIPTGASLYPNTNPTVGNTGAGQAAFPPSFFHTSRPAYWSASIPWPAIGPDVVGGNVGQCAGILNVAGRVNGVPATNASQCAGSALSVTWGGHVNANPAMSCYLTVMGGPPDGSGGLLNFDASVCYAGGSGIPTVTLNPSGLNFGNVSPLCLPSAVCPNLTVTVTNTGTANLVFAASSAITISACSPACGSDLALNTGVQTCANNSIVAPGNSCTVVVTFDPSLQAIQESATVTLTDNAGSGTQTFPVTGIGLAPSPATSFAMLTGNTIVQGKVILP